MSTESKTQKLAEAAKLRTRVEREALEANRPDPSDPNKMSDEELANLQENAAERVAVRPQAVAQSLTGELDPNAMGDVKGDGGDARDYPDSDPDKALGVPVYEHGLAETRLGGDALEPAMRKVFGQEQSARTQAELDRGREALSSRKAVKEEPRTGRTGRTVVTDTTTDPDGDDGRARAEKAAEEAKAKVAAKAKAEAEEKAKAEADAKKK